MGFRRSRPAGRGSPTLQAEIEARAYFIVAEALTNVAKHAHAERAQVRASLHEGVLHVEVSDDGIGGADPRGRGTRLTATLPVLRHVPAVDPE